MESAVRGVGCCARPALALHRSASPANTNRTIHNDLIDRLHGLMICCVLRAYSSRIEGGEMTGMQPINEPTDPPTHQRRPDRDTNGSSLNCNVFL